MAAWIASLALAAAPASAQFLRVGPFNFDAKVTARVIYTTNVEGQSPAESDGAEMKDTYFVLALDMPGRADVSPNTTARLDLGVAVEKHVNRPDLDNSSEPLGRARFQSTTQLNHLTVDTHASIQESSASATDTYVPGRSRLTRMVSKENEYGAGVNWKSDILAIGYTYDLTSTRYVDEQFMVGDQDSESRELSVLLALVDDVNIHYIMDQTRSDLIHDEQDPVWLTTETVTIDWMLEFWRHPRTTYSIGLEKEDTEEQKGSWDVTHSIAAEDEYEFSRSIRGRFNARYELEDHPESTDISLTYGGSLEQDLGRTSRHSISVMRQPVGTFGSTKDTDQTSWNYLFSKRDLFIYDLSLNFGARYDIERPMDEALPEERTTSYDVDLDHTVRVSRHLSRSLSYQYSWEKSDLEIDPVTEHRVTLSYVYDF